MIKPTKPLSAYKGKQKAGKWFEKELVEPALHLLEKSCSAFQHRFVDTNEARNLVRGQPSDYLLAMGGKALLVEAKASMVKDRFIASMLEPSQVSGMYRWSRAGLNSLIVFYSAGRDEIDIYDGGKVVAKKMDGGRVGANELLISGPAVDIDDLLRSAVSML